MHYNVLKILSFVQAHDTQELKCFPLSFEADIPHFRLALLPLDSKSCGRN